MVSVKSIITTLNVSQELLLSVVHVLKLNTRDVIHAVHLSLI